MVTWFWQRKKAPAERTLKLRSRGDFGDVRRVDFEALAPDVNTFLGQAAYLQLGYFETLSQLIAPTEDLGDKEALSVAAGAALRKHRGLVEVIRARGDEAREVMLPFRESLDAFRGATHGARPLETILSVYLTAGMLDDFYRALSRSYASTGREAAEILSQDDDRQELAALIADATRDDAQLRALLAMWGRRLVGDTLLVARGALAPATLDAADEKKVEPVFTDLMAAHSKRMAALGLDA